MFGAQPFQMQSQQQPQPQFQQQQQQTVATLTQQFADALSKVAIALTRPSLHGGDERDVIIAKLNRLLAFAGCGKGYFHLTSAPVDFGPENPFCRFKAIGYNRLGGHKNEDGLLSFLIQRNANDVSNQRQNFVDGIFKIMGSKQNLSFAIDNIRPIPKDKDNNERCEILGYVTEISAINGVQRRIPALESFAFFNQQANKAQLSQLLQVVELSPKVDPSLDKLEEYISVTPQGIDMAVWRQAQCDNPDPTNLVPWPILGFPQLRERQIMQQQEVTRQNRDVQKLVQRIDRVEQTALTSQSRLAQLKVTEDQLSHRVMKLFGIILRRSREGHALDVNEETLHSRLESVFLRLNGPLQIKGRLSELLSHYRSRNYAVAEQLRLRANADEAAFTSKFVENVKQQLKTYQESLESVVKMVQNDLSDLDVIEDALKNKDRLVPRK